MTKIKVNHKKLTSTASKIEENVDTAKKMMSDNEKKTTQMIKSFWNGEDAFMFIDEIERLTRRDPRFKKWVEMNLQTSKFLDSAANAYLQAQANAINRAQKIKKD